MKRINIGERNEENYAMIEIMKQEIRGLMNEPISYNKVSNKRNNEHSNEKVKRKRKAARTKGNNANSKFSTFLQFVKDFAVTVIARLIFTLPAISISLPLPCYIFPASGVANFPCNFPVSLWVCVYVCTRCYSVYPFASPPA